MIINYQQGNQILEKWELPYGGKDGGLYIKVDEEKGTIYFTLDNCHQVFHYTLDGKKLGTFGSEEKSSEIGKFFDPRGLALNNSLYVCDRNNHRIQVLDKKEGKYLSHKGTYGVDQGEFYYPSGIVYFENHFYISDSFRVQVLDQDLKFLKYLGKGAKSERGDDEGEFAFPKGLCVIPSAKTLYVADSWNHRIQQFKI